MRVEHASERLLDQDELEPEVVVTDGMPPAEDAAEPADDAASVATETPEQSADLDLLNLYLEQTTRELLLTREQEAELACTIEHADRMRAALALGSPLGLRFLRDLAT